MKKTQITQAQLDKIKINTRASFIYSLESANSVADLFGSYFVRGDITPLLDYEKNLNALTATQIQEVAKKYFTNQNSTTLIMTR